MKICFAYITPFHPNKGGVGRVTDTLSRALIERGHNVFYLIYDVTQRHEFDYPAPLEYLPSKKCLSPENVEYYFQYLEKNKIDVVINQSGNFSDSRLWCKAREKGVKVVSVLHTYPTTSLKRLWHCDILPLRNDSTTEKLKRLARIFLYRKIKSDKRKRLKEGFDYINSNSDQIVALSQRQFNELEEISNPKRENYYFIPNPNSYEVIDKTPEKKNMILFTGLFGTIKREDLLIKAWKRIYKNYPDWELVIVGYGDEKRSKLLKRLSSGIKNIRFVGYQNPRPYQEKASIIAVTSVAEGWCMVLTEGMQFGAVPVVFDSFQAARDIIKNNENGFLVKPFNVKDYSVALSRLIEDSKLRGKMAEKAKKSVERFDVSVIADKWEDMLNNL